MSQMATSEPDGYAHCNGNSRDNIKVNVEKGTTPNGIHILPGKKEKNRRHGEEDKRENEELRNGSGSGDDSHEEATSACNSETTKLIKDVLEEEKLYCEDDKSTNELIDEFSTAMALSLIHSSNSEGFENAEHSPKSTSRDDVMLQTPALETGHIDTKVPDKSLTSDDVVDSADAERPASKTSNSDSLVMEKDGVVYVRYESELQMPAIMQLITKDLSEPYSIYTYRYFIHNWPHLCFLAMFESNYVGAIVCKLDLHKKITRRGYIAMLAVDQSVRRRNIGTSLVKMAIETMNMEGCDEVVLETEVTNKPALKLYENLGFVRDKRLFRYYLNGVDALRLKLWLR